MIKQNKKLIKSIDKNFFNFYLINFFSNKEFLLSFCKSYKLFITFNNLSDKELLIFLIARLKFKTRIEINKEKKLLKMPNIIHLVFNNFCFSYNMYIQICLFIWNYCFGLFLFNKV